MKNVLTPEGIVNFPKLFKAEAYEGSDPKYSVELIFDKETDLSELKTAAKAALKEKFGEIPKKFRTPFRDGDEISGGGFDDCKWIRCKCNENRKPGVVDADVAPIIDPSEIYSGCRGRASVLPFAYDAGGKGVTFILQHFQKTADGEKLFPESKPEDVFARVESDDDDDGMAF